jgi:hypothetical protein
MAGRLTLDQARKALQELHPDLDVTVEPFTPDGWELQFDLPFGPGARQIEFISGEKLQMNDRETMLRQLDYVIRREVGKSEELDRQSVRAETFTADPYEAQALAYPRRGGKSSWDRVAADDYADSLAYALPKPYMVSDKDLAWAKFTGVRSPAPAFMGRASTAPTPELEPPRDYSKMPFEAYVAELHAALGPEGRGL